MARRVGSRAALPLRVHSAVLRFFCSCCWRAVLGRGIAGLLGHPLAFSFRPGSRVGEIYSLPFAVQPIVSRLFRSRLLPARRSAMLAQVTFGLSSAYLFHWPPFDAGSRGSCISARRGRVRRCAYAAGGDPGATRTLSIVLYNQVERFTVMRGANPTAALLLCLSVVALAAIYAGARPRGGRHA